MRWLTTFRLARGALLAACCTVSGGCSSEGSSAASEVGAYLQDTAARRHALEASLVNPQNGYSALRLAHYATGIDGDWDRLPEWNPVVEPVSAAELDVPRPADSTLSESAAALALPAHPERLSDTELIALGKVAFERYPVQLAPYFDTASSSSSAAQTYGLWVDATRGVGGLVRAQMADGTSALAITCSTCHAAAGPTRIENGLPNSALNVGAARLAAQTDVFDTATAAAIGAWGPGRLDVTTPGGTEPARIPDLRPVRFLTYLQQDATVALHDLTALAIRIETLIITSSGQVLRPPRLVAWALAAYLESLSDGLPLETAAAKVSPGGSALFREQCASCHVPPALTGPPVALEIIGTDPTLGLSADRGTGSYRVPSLHGVGTRGPLLHDGTVASLDAFFDPSRPKVAFSGRLQGTGPVPGHVFGLDLAPSDRAALLAYLQAL